MPLRQTQPSNSHAFVFIDDAHTFGGAQIALAWAIRAIIRNTERPVVCVCTPRTKDAILAIVGATEKLTLIDCPPALPLNTATFPLRVVPFFKILRRLKQQGVGTWWLNLSSLESCLAPLAVLKAMGERHAAWVHCTEAMSILFPACNWWRRILNRTRDLVASHLLLRFHPVLATPSKAASEVLRKRAGADSPVPHLYPTVSRLDHAAPTTPEICSDESRTINLWMIGRVEFGTKNNIAAIDAFRALKKRGFTVSVTVVGDGPDMDELQAICSDLNLADGLTFSGWSTNPWLTVASDDIVLIPSLSEGMPLVAIEAMLRGIRIVTSPLPMFYEGVPEEFIADGFSGEVLAGQVERVIQMSRSEVLRLYSESIVKFSEERFINTLTHLSHCSPTGSEFVAATEA